MNTKHVFPLLTFLCFFHLSIFAKEVTVSDADNGKKVFLQAKDTLRLDLVGNPTTGFTWEIIQNGAPQIASIENSYAPASTLCGAGGTFSFWFKAGSLGTATLKLNYLRPWKKEEPPTQQFNLTIVVQAS